MKRALSFGLAFLLFGLVCPARAEPDVTWEEILQRLDLARSPEAVFRDVVRPLIDRPATLEATFEKSDTDEAGRPRQQFRHVSGRHTFVCYTDAESAPAAPGWHGAITGLLVELDFKGEDPQGRRYYILRLRQAGTTRLP
ncbi:MAG TPA: hypothetical protein P5567_06415 [Kiritimatiellia bacterium]|nr:hypothetical protein [Kiritimatiellia bacterium]HRZ12070.1 hypothetical protein [Kiritimatiellia bacterium]HSA19599.1 hypothetical protein [Kiritimatiellia bacterium]